MEIENEKYNKPIKLNMNISDNLYKDLSDLHSIELNN